MALLICLRRKIPRATQRQVHQTKRIPSGESWDPCIKKKIILKYYKKHLEVQQTVACSYRLSSVQNFPMTSACTWPDQWQPFYCHMRLSALSSSF